MSIVDGSRPAWAALEQGPMVESISDYYRRRADQERQCADEVVDDELRRIHLDKAKTMEKLAREYGRGG